jgi:hypothetical protein
MNDSESSFETTTSSEVNEELNGKDASTRHASMISAPRLIMKQRIRGALVPMRRTE